MGSLQNLTRGGISSATSSSSVSGGGGSSSAAAGAAISIFFSGPGTSNPSPNFNGRLTPTASSSIGGGGGGTFSQPPPNLHQQQRHSTFGMNLMQSTTTTSPAGNPGRNPLFSRDRSKMSDSLLGPNTFDPSEFPSLGQNSAPNPSLSGRPNYASSISVGMVKQPAMEASEFTMSHEDFPALPGSAPSNSNSIGGVPHNVQNNAFEPHHSSLQGGMIGGPGAIGSVASMSGHPSQVGGGIGGGMMGTNDRMTSQGLHQDNPSMGVGSAVSQAAANDFSAKRGIQTSPDGTVKNIPSSMVTDQFGMIGLLTFIRAAETDPNLVSLALGADLTTLGLNLNSEVNLYPTFGGPWAETPCRPQDIDFHVPHEYLTNQAIRDKLAPVKLNRYKDDVLFYMFYTNVGDVLQLAAAAELYNRDWRYHREDRVWITRAPGMAPSEKTSTYERGTYYFFDVTNWRKVPKDFHLDYDKLEDRPSLPQNLGGSNAGGGGGGGVGPPPSMPPQMPPPVTGPGGGMPGMSLSPTSMPPPSLVDSIVGGASRQQHSPSSGLGLGGGSDGARF